MCEFYKCVYLVIGCASSPCNICGCNCMYFGNWRFSCPTGKNIVHSLPYRYDTCAHLLQINTMMAPQIYTFIVNWLCKLTKCGVMW